MKLLTAAIVTITIIMTLIGCTRTSRIGHPQFVPESWIALRSNAWQILNLPQTNKQELYDLQVMLANERNGQYYNFYGTYSPKVQSEIDATSSRLNQVFLDLKYSTKYILANLSPELDGLSETHAERKARIAVVNDQISRMSRDDLNRALLLDKASMLSPYPVVTD